MRSSAAGERPGLLAVDDDLALCEALTCGLEDTYQVHTAATGAGALAILQSEPIAAILLDAVLQDEDGLELIPHLRARSPAPIILFTGHGSEAMAIRAIDLRVAKYLKKPLDLGALRSAIRQLVPLSDPESGLAVRAREILEASLADPFDPEGFARQMGVSEVRLRRAFRTVYGTTPHRYLTKRRLDRAAERLRGSHFGVEEIAHEVGFPTGAWFTKLFTRVYRMSPSAYREAATAPSTRRASGAERIPAPKGSAV